jgi:hypothetical protein
MDKEEVDKILPVKIKEQVDCAIILRDRAFYRGDMFNSEHNHRKG